MVAIELVNEQEANLLGLILKGILERNLKDRELPAWCQKKPRTVHVKAGQMTVTVRLAKEGVRIERGHTGQAGASVAGTLKAFMNVATGGALVGPVLKGHIKIGGNPLLLLKMLPLLRV
ncbi:MAG: hypothetical protein JW797_19765 [Bradymonadales bacterium]|nr:hypothetical protein [Bradymonadales bacterium]